MRRFELITPRISILMISFNQVLFLRDAILSVIGQDISDWELICVDAGSLDGSREIIQEFSRIDTRIRYFFQPDEGPADGLNIALSKCTGQIFGCLNSDDMYLPGTFSRVSSAFAANPRAACIYGHGFVLQGKYMTPLTSDRFSPARYFKGRGLVVQQSTFFLKSKLREHNLSFNPTNRSCWDGELLIDCTMSNLPLVRVNEFWGIFRIHESSITGSQTSALTYNDDSDRIFKKFRQIQSVDRPFWITVRAYALYRRCRNLIFIRLFFPEAVELLRLKGKYYFELKFEDGTIEE
jgi:glycosyltransferase involved in cell wall biosynthesis